MSTSTRTWLAAASILAAVFALAVVPFTCTVVE